MIRTRVGYAGGSTESPTYRQMGDHAETIAIDYDPGQINFEELLAVFWKSHNPLVRTWSSQYQVILFFHDATQAELAYESRKRMARELDAPVFTEIRPASRFYPAESYHQKYRLRQDRMIHGEFTRMYPDEWDLIHSTAAARVNGILGGFGARGVLEASLAQLGLSPAGQQRLRERLRL